MRRVLAAILAAQHGERMTDLVLHDLAERLGTATIDAARDADRGRRPAPVTAADDARRAEHAILQATRRHELHVQPEAREQRTIGGRQLGHGGTRCPQLDGAH